MRILILGQGKRQEALRHLALSRGHSLPESGPWDAVALPLPRSEIAEEAADQLPRDQKVICGMTDETLERLAKKKGWTLLRILEDERYLQANACLTAEGALQRCMNSTEKAVQDMNCLVIGFGRIGKALTGNCVALSSISCRSLTRHGKGGNHYEYDKPFHATKIHKPS